MTVPPNHIQRVKELYKEEVMARPNVVGVGIGFRQTDGEITDEIVVVTLVRRKVAEEGLARDQLVPAELNGVRTDVVEVGELRALQAPTDRWRPAPGGVSIGHFRISAGTLGVVVRDRVSGERLILSNNHVLANSNDATAGDPILQPGGADGGSVPGDVIANLARFVPIEFTVAPPSCGIATTVADVLSKVAEAIGSQHRVRAIQVNQQANNLVDAAVARPLQDDLVLDEILQIGEVSGTVPATLGMAVRKSGRTTGYTEGTITVLDATVNVNYGLGRIARFENQIVSTPMSEGGDSGSLVVAANSQQAVGLLYAGSTQSTIFNPIGMVLESLQVTL